MYAKEKQPDRPVWLLLRLTCSVKTCRFCQLPLPWKKRLSRSAELVGAKPLHLLTQTALPLKSPTGAFIAALRSANAVAPNAKLKMIFPLNMASNDDDRRQRRKQGGVVGAAASKTQVPPKARCGCWVPQPGSKRRPFQIVPAAGCPLSCKSAGMCYNKNHLFHTIYVGIWAAAR